MALIEEIDNDGASSDAEKKLQPKMTDEERTALAEKMDKELDEFIDSLEKRGYTEGWPEDRWEEVSLSSSNESIQFMLLMYVCVCSFNLRK